METVSFRFISNVTAFVVFLAALCAVRFNLFNDDAIRERFDCESALFD